MNENEIAELLGIDPVEVAVVRDGKNIDSLITEALGRDDISFARAEYLLYLVKSQKTLKYCRKIIDRLIIAELNNINIPRYGVETFLNRPACSKAVKTRCIEVLCADVLSALAKENCSMVEAICHRDNARFGFVKRVCDKVINRCIIAELKGKVSLERVEELLRITGSPKMVFRCKTELYRRIKAELKKGDLTPERAADFYQMVRHAGRKAKADSRYVAMETLCYNAVEYSIKVEMEQDKITPERASKLCSLSLSNAVKKKCAEKTDSLIIAELNQGNVASERIQVLYRLASQGARQQILKQL